MSEAGFSGPVKATLTGRLDKARPSDQLKGEGTKPGTYTIQVSCQGAPLTVTASESRSLRPTVSKTFECDAPGSASHTARSTEAFTVHNAPLVTSVSAQGTTQFLVAVVEGDHVITAKP